MILRHVQEYGYQPNTVELCELLGVKAPSVRGRIHHLIAKGLLRAAPRRGERCWGFVGLKFLAYQVDDRGNPLPDQEFEVGDCIVTFRKKNGGANSKDNEQ